MDRRQLQTQILDSESDKYIQIQIKYVQILLVHDNRQCNDDDDHQGGASAAPHPPPRLHRPLHRLCHQEEARQEFR